MNPTTRQPVGQMSGNNPFMPPTVAWSVGLFDCCNDMGECFYAYFCSCCFMCTLAKSINERSACGCCVPNRLAVYRMKLRTALHIEGDAVNDCCVTAWCGCCAALQMKVELKNRGLA